MLHLWTHAFRLFLFLSRAVAARAARFKAEAAPASALAGTVELTHDKAKQKQDLKVFTKAKDIIYEMGQLKKQTQQEGIRPGEMERLLSLKKSFDDATKEMQLQGCTKL